MHFFFDGAKERDRWQKHAASTLTRSDVLTGEPEEEDELRLLPDDALLVLVAPCNRNRGRASIEAGKLESVQRLVCGARHVPIILINPDLEALLLTQRVGRAPVPPMFLSDFEHAFFLAAATAKIGYVTAVRRVWGSAWEVYRVEQERAEANGDGDARRAQSLGASAGTAALERIMLTECFKTKPRSADALADYARRSRGRSKLPGKTTEARWAAEQGWGMR